MMTESTLLRDVDRYIDGEAADQQLTELLRRCEQESDGWTVCALALIEAHEVTQGLKAMIDPSGPDESVTSSATEERMPHGRVVSFRPRRTWAAGLATGLVCLLVGTFCAGRYWPGASPAGPDVADDLIEPAAGEPLIVQTPPPEIAAAVSVVGFARIHQQLGMGPPVPVIAGRNLNFAELLKQSPELPEHVRRRAGNQGLQVTPLRQVMALELSDGQRLAVPLDSVGVRFVGHSVL